MYATVQIESFRNGNGRAPINCVFDNSSDVFVIERITGFVTGMEIEYLSQSACEGHSASEDISVFIPRTEKKIVGLGNKEGFAVKLFLNFKK